MKQLILLLSIFFLHMSKRVIAQEKNVFSKLECSLSLGGEYLNGDVVGLSGLLYDGRIKRDTKDRLNLSFNLGFSYSLTQKNRLGFLYKTGNISGSVRDYNTYSNMNYMKGVVSHISLIVDRDVFQRSAYSSSKTDCFIRAGAGLSYSKGDYIQGNNNVSFKYNGIPHGVFGFGMKREISSNVSFTMLLNTYIMFSDKVDGIVSSLGGNKDMLYSINVGVNWSLNSLFNSSNKREYKSKDNDVFYSDNIHEHDSIVYTSQNVKNTYLESENTDSLFAFNENNQELTFRINSDTSYCIRTNYEEVNEGDNQWTQCLYREIIQDTIYDSGSDSIYELKDSRLLLEPLVVNDRIDTMNIETFDSVNTFKRIEDTIVDNRIKTNDKNDIVEVNTPIQIPDGLEDSTLFTYSEYEKEDISVNISNSEFNSVEDSLELMNVMLNKEEIILDKPTLELEEDVVSEPKWVKGDSLERATLDIENSSLAVDSLFDVYLLDTLQSLSSKDVRYLELRKTNRDKSSLNSNSSPKYSLFFTDTKNVLHVIEVSKVFKIKYDNHINTEIKLKLKDVAMFMRKSNIESCIIVSNRNRTTSKEIRFMQNLFKVCNIQHNISTHKLSLYHTSMNTNVLKSIIIYVVD